MDRDVRYAFERGLPVKVILLDRKARPMIEQINATLIALVGL
jgi:hypothetical protein